MPAWLDNWLAQARAQDPRGLIAQPTAEKMERLHAGGLLEQTPRQRLQTAGLLGAPVVSDLAGLASDVMMYRDEPESRTPGNYALSALGLVPFIPGALSSVSDTFYRGSKAGDNIGQFFSRDKDYAQAFDKGAFGAYNINTQKAIRFGETLEPDDIAPIVKALEQNGDVKTARMIQEAVTEDGGVLADHLYQWLDTLGSAAPEYYLRKAGIEAIDTGRDVRVLTREIVQ